MPHFSASNALGTCVARKFLSEPAKGTDHPTLTHKRIMLTTERELQGSNRSGQFSKVALPATAARILVADRSGLLLRSLKAAPAAAEFEFLSATDGREALEMACTELPDLIVTDSEMPRMNGIELCKAVRRGVWLRPPIVLVTDSRNRQLLTAATQAGADFCLLKPVDLTRLIDLIRALTR
jgi:CheY-like chemotaxis protein